DADFRRHHHDRMTEGDRHVEVSAKVSFGTMPGASRSAGAPGSDAPYRIAVLADFSGRQNRGVTGSSADVAERRLLRVSKDTLDNAMAKLDVQLKLPVGDGGATVELSFAS